MTQQRPPSNDKHFSRNLSLEDAVCELTGYDDPMKQPKRYATYVIECEGYDDTRYGTDEKLKDDWRYWAKSDEFEGYTPWEPEGWAWAAYYSNRVFYVGQTKWLLDRFLDHKFEPEKTSIFNVVFSPMRIEKVEWHSSREKALQRERELAEEYSDRGKGWFSYYA